VINQSIGFQENKKQPQYQQVTIYNDCSIPLEQAKRRFENFKGYYQEALISDYNLSLQNIGELETGDYEREKEDILEEIQSRKFVDINLIQNNLGSLLDMNAGQGG